MFSILIGEHQQWKNTFRISNRYLGDPKVLNGITWIWNEEFRNKLFFHKFQQSQRYYKQYCKNENKKIRKWRENENKLRQKGMQATIFFSP